MDFLRQYKNALFLIAVLLAQAIALAVQVRRPLDAAQPDGPSVRLIRMWAMTTVTPLERVTHAIGHGARYGWSEYIDLRHVRQQNKELQQQLARVRIEEAAIAEDAQQGRRLQAMLGFREHYVGSTVAAEVIGASGSEQSYVLTIDKGSRDGLRPDMAVITQDGVVGKLRDVFPTTSQVLELNDQSSGAGVVLASTRIRAILRGTLTGRVQIGNLTADSRIKPGEPVLTSGGDQVYPRGLPVGVVESIAPDPEHQPYTAIRVKPAVDLDRVEEVLVITGTQAELTPAAQQDLADAAAQHAADLSAERLPGIHDDETPGAANGTAAATPPAANAPAVIPHPLPTLHPDRFTSGSTPPASAMTPGAASSAPSSQGAPSSQQPPPPQAQPQPEATK
ncbi:MAG: rod shape-determining protein MreC [Acidobacteriaceae bacterium]|jgi:rod shape-determining protein MreC